MIVAATAAMIYSLLHYSIWSFGMPGSGLMPVIACAMIVVACLWTILARDTGERARFASPPLAYCVGFVAILALTSVIGLLPALAIVAAAILRFEGMSLPRSILIAVAVALGSWLLFERTLMVPLPGGAIWGS
nr:tripartite tricarboxylate transporter TctB family protein [Pseudaminobacter soli]